MGVQNKAPLRVKSRLDPIFSQNFGLGQYFLDSLFSDIDSLQLFAGIHSWYFGYQRLLSKRFPFTIYYRVDNGIIKIHAVLDCRQDPKKIKSRMT